jgi:hypothetical protein
VVGLRENKGKYIYKNKNYAYIYRHKYIGGIGNDAAILRVIYPLPSNNILKYKSVPI